MEYGGYIRTVKNRKFYFNNLENNEYDIEEIAHALSLQCRWTGHCSSFHSIAQHSVHCFDMAVETGVCRPIEALLHDASEAYMIDASRPLKDFIPDYVALNKRLEEVIAGRFNVPFPMSPGCRQIDNRMLATEWEQLFDETDIVLGVTDPPFDIDLPEWSPRTAEKEFLDRYYTNH